MGRRKRKSHKRRSKSYGKARVRSYGKARVSVKAHSRHWPLRSRRSKS